MPDLMVSDLRSGRVADPVHGYVRFTAIERLIIDQRVAQRLRYISQTSVAHLVYPEVRTSRLSHSLGAMHLASGFLASSLRNASEATQERLAQAVKDAVCAVAGQVSDPERAATALSDQFLDAAMYVRSEYAPHIRIAEQAVRLAALFHDLGHLPYSHDVEGALEDYWRRLPPEQREVSPLKPVLQQWPGALQIHERIGHALSLLLLRELFGAIQDSDRSETVRITFELAQRIIDSEEAEFASPAEAATYWLHSLIDGELDVDRCDYILRDGRNYGFEFASYDLNRLLDNLLVVPVGNRFVLAVKSQGASAVETFLLSRFRSYQYGVRHHKVAQADEALRYSIARILARAGDAEVDRFVRDLGSLAQTGGVPDAERAGFLRRFAGYDDVWWTLIMRAIPEGERDEWLDLVCWRQRGPRSLWKRTAEFPGTVPLREWNRRLPSLTDLDAMQRWSDEISKLREAGVLVVRHRFVPWKAEPESDDPSRPEMGRSRLCILEGSHSLVPISDRSPLVRALREAWANDIQVHAFALSSSKLAAEQVLDRLPINPN